MAGQGYLHPDLGFAIVVPDAASLLEQQPSKAIFALAGAGPDRPAILTVEVQPIDPEWDSQTFAREALAAQAAVLGRLRVIDHQPAVVDGQAAVRVVLQRQDEGGVVVLDEWRLAQQGRGWTVSALCPVASYWALAPLIEASAASFVPPEPVKPLPQRAALDPETGVLSVTAAELSALTDLYEGRPSETEEARNALARLEEAGVVEGGRPVPPVEAMLATASGATLKLTVQRPDPDAMAWCREGDVTLLLRLGEEARQLVAVPAGRLPGILADLVELGPRPTDPAREPVRLTLAELSAAFAGEASEGVVAERRGHWRIDARMADGHAILEALDSTGGWWLLRPEDQEVTLEPVTAAVLFMHLTELAAA